VKRGGGGEKKAQNKKQKTKTEHKTDESEQH
jgi:hypothetical protein